MKTIKKPLPFFLFLILITTISYAQPTDNVVAYYPFNGNANDVTVNGKNCTVTGATLTSDRLGKVNAAYSFNGSSTYMCMPTALLPGSNAFAFSCWIKTVGNHSSSDFGQVFIDLRGQYQIALGYFQPNNPANLSAVQFYNYSYPTTIAVISPNNSIQINTWYHIVANYGNNTMTLYINGNLVGTQASNAPSACSGYSNTIGKDYNTGLNRGWFNGSIDEVLVYKRSLTPDEILAIYNRGLVSSEIPELYSNPSVQYTYDAIGRRTGRNVITLKSATEFIQRDSAYVAQEIFNENLGSQNVIIYPNPTRGHLKVDIQELNKETDAAIYLYDLSGKLLIIRKPASSNTLLELSGYPTGTYILKIIIGDKTSEWKIIKE